MKNAAATVRTIDLGYEQMLVLEGGRDTKVRVLYGGAWLTEEGTDGDAIVGTGDEVRLQSRGRALLEGLGPTRLQIEASGRSGSAVHGLRRLGVYLRRLVERLHLGMRPAAEPNG